MTDINVRLHAWSTRFHLGLVLSQIACLTAGSHEPRASQRVTTWEDHSPHARNVQHTDSEDRVMPLASFQKEAKGVASPVPSVKETHLRKASCWMFRSLFLEASGFASADNVQRHSS